MHEVKSKIVIKTAKFHLNKLFLCRLLHYADLFFMQKNSEKQFLS